MESLPTDRRVAGALRSALLLGAGYLLVGTLWILLSDTLVEAISADPVWRATAQRYKGLVYIGLTTLALVYLVHLGYQRLLALQRRLDSSDLRVRDLFLNHPQPMWVYDLDDYHLLRVNDAALVAYGYGREAFLAMNAKDLHPPEEVASFLAAARLRGVGNGSPGVFRHRTRSGATLLARISEHLVELQGRPAMMVMAEDVTEEVRLQDAVQRQQRQFRQLHESLGEVLWMATPDFHTMVYVSPAFATLYGRSPEALLARPGLWREVVHPDDRGQVADLRELPPGVDQVECEYRIVRPDGSTRWIQDRKRLIRDESGAVALVGGIVEDISVRKERDEARDALNSRLGALVTERTQALEQANLELEAFSRTAAHDLKSPLNGIVGMSQLLKMKAGAQLDETCRRYLDRIERSAHDMATLINDLLALSRAGSAALDLREVDLAPVARAQIEELRLLEPLRQVEVELPPRLAMCCDQGLMRSVLQNLIGNAWKFSAHTEQARLRLDIEQTADESILTVSDNGAGFDASAATGVLQPFQRFHAQAQFQGTGLGLVTCQRIVQRHGGRLRLESTPGQGTRVTVALPSRRARDAVRPAAAAAAA